MEPRWKWTEKENSTKLFVILFFIQLLQEFLCELQYPYTYIL